MLAKDLSFESIAQYFLEGTGMEVIGFSQAFNF